LTLHLFLAAAGGGKTAYVLELVRNAAQGLLSTPRVVVPTQLQVRAWRRRLAHAGGAMGVRVLTFDRLYAECLNAAGEAYTELSEPVQYRLIRGVVDSLPLLHYAPLAARPGFIQILERLIGELKAARIHPDEFARAVAGLGREPRLAELAQIYAAYQERLQARGWADRAGLGWLAVEALEERAPGVAYDWPLLAVDGFDQMSSVQLAMLQVLARRACETVITLTGTVDGTERPLAHRRFHATRRTLEAVLAIEAEPLPAQAAVRSAAAPLVHLEASLYGTPTLQLDAGGAVDLIEAPDRAAEVRAALRWLKARMVDGGMRPGEVAVLARNVTPYRPFLLQVAAEFGLPLRLAGGLPLRANPAIAALLNLLRLMLPAGGRESGPALPRRRVVEAWRSPYFDWSALPWEGAPQPIGITAADAQALDVVTRWGRVIGGLSQWREAFARMAVLAASGAEAEQDEGELDEERGWPRGLPRGGTALALRDKFERFLRRLTPPGEGSYQAFVRWLEELIGPDPELQSARFPAPEQASALNLVARARSGPAETKERDVAALHSLKDVLRGLVWAEEALGAEALSPVTFATFFRELAGAVESTTYQPAPDMTRSEVLAADVVQARGVPFRAVALLGLAEGEFPASIDEDPFLRDAERGRLRREYGLPLEPSTQSAEAEFFYEAITRPWERLLLTRPRLADNGALWQASPYWEEVRRLVRAEPLRLTSESVPPPCQVASWPELVESLASHQGYGRLRAWAAQSQPQRLSALERAVQILCLRGRGAGGSPYNGELGCLEGVFERAFGPGFSWSASGLESYRTCPFGFLVGRVLRLEPRVEPAEGLDPRQRGILYHQLLEQVYQAPGVDDAGDVAQLLAALPGVAAAVLDAAPEELGFRETAWWLQSRAEMVDKVHRSIEALAVLPGGFVPYRHEAPFGRSGWPHLVVCQGQDSFRLRGIIDRVDRAPDGRVRVVDYKTAGPSSYNDRAVAEGEKLQLPLYALAARDALRIGQPAEGFYWHVQHAEPSPFRLSSFEDGPQGAIGVALEKAWEAVRGARKAHFAPQPPPGGCPGYCPAAGFCWTYRPVAERGG
jgi:ATP-dependent helicase/DNAse subunit B